VNIALARTLVSTLPVDSPLLFNPWAQRCDYDTDLNGPEQRLERLAQHLDCDARLILCGEAPGYQGCRFSGVAFTSEKLLLQGAIPRVTQPAGRLTMRHIPYSEPSATIVWGQLYKLGLAESTILWNALQLHPFKPAGPFTNRTPTPSEFAYGHEALRLLKEAFPHAKFIAVGSKAEGHLADARIPVYASVRHPANGGANIFRLGLAERIQG
jgi:uracil-DNA glycosylase